jgi:phosphoglycerate kinase
MIYDYMGLRTLDDLTVEGATIGVRIDVNSPLDEQGELADDARLRAHLDTLSELLERGGRVAILAHQGRPGGDEFRDLLAHAAHLDDLLSQPVDYTDSIFSMDAREQINALDDGQAIVLENTRFYSEEYMEIPPAEAADTYLVARLAPVFDAYVNDAFAAAHRTQPSLVGFPRHLPSYAGRVMETELDVLGAIDETPRPRVYALGGAKIADALDVAESVLDRGLADDIITSGMVGNVFSIAAGAPLGDASADPIRERDAAAISRAGALLDEYDDLIHRPTDVAVACDGQRCEHAIDDVPDGEPALDIGTGTVEHYEAVLDTAETAVINGPAGVFEDDRFALGTERLFAAVATRADYSIVGGGDTAAAIRQLGIDGFDHVSTGGGAALRMLTDSTLPAVEELANSDRGH